MLLAVWLAFGFMMAELIETTFRRTGLDGGRAQCVRDLLIAMAWALALWVYWWVAETNLAIGRTEIGGRVGALATAVPLVVAALSNCCLSCCCKVPMAVVMGRASFRKARRRFVLGFVVALVGATAWILTENMCDRPDYIGTIFKWLPGHFLWHVLMSYGMTQALLFAGALRADNFHSRVTIDTNGQGILTFGLFPGLTSWYFFLMPRLVLTPIGEVAYGEARVSPEADPATAAHPMTLSVPNPADAYGVRPMKSPGKKEPREEEDGLMVLEDTGDV